jgi:hypothetical protein
MGASYVLFGQEHDALLFGAYIKTRPTGNAQLLINRVFFLGFSRYCVSWTDPGAHVATGAWVMIDLVSRKLTTHACRADLVVDVSLVLISKVLQG